MMMQRWFLTGLLDAGVDISKYTAKTTHHVSSSKAFFAGVSIDTVMLCTGWSNVSLFVTHYNLPVICKNKDRAVSGSSPIQSPIAVAKHSNFRLSCAHAFKTSKNVRAQQLLEMAQQDQFKRAVALQNLPFSSPPPTVPRVTLDKPVLIEILSYTSRRGTLFFKG